MPPLEFDPDEDPSEPPLDPSPGGPLPPRLELAIKRGSPPRTPLEAKQRQTLALERIAAVLEQGATVNVQGGLTAYRSDE